MQIHELNNFAGTPTSSDYLAIDNSTTTTKIGATGLGVQDKLTVAEANTGTSTASRIVTPKVVHDYVTGEVSDGIDNITTSATETKWANITGGDGSIDDALNYVADTETYSSTPVEVGKYGTKTIYRKVFSGNTPSAAGVIFSDSCLDTYLFMYGNVKNSGGSFLPITGYYVASNDYMIAYPQNGDMQFRAGRYDVLGGKPYFIAVYYTDS